MDVPEAWLVEPMRADLDLDNLRLADLGAAPSLQVRAHAGHMLCIISKSAGTVMLQPEAGAAQLLPLPKF